MSLNAALYARVSTSSQDPEMQLIDLRQLAEGRAWTIVDEYVDIGFSGSRERRPALDRLMADCHEGRINVVAVWKFDRFARSTRHLVTALDNFKAQGIDLVSVRDQADTTTAMGRAMYTIIAAIAELERDLIRERVVAGVERARRQGKRLGRPPRVRIDRARVATLLGQGLSTRAIARELGAPETSVRRVVQTLRQNPSADDPAKA